MKALFFMIALTISVFQTSVLQAQVQLQAQAQLDSMADNIERFRTGDQYYVTSHVLLASLETALAVKLAKYASRFRGDAKRIKYLQAELEADRIFMAQLAKDSYAFDSETLRQQRAELFQRIDNNERELAHVQRGLIVRSAKAGVRVLFIAGAVILVVEVGAKVYGILTTGSDVDLFPVAEAVADNADPAIQYLVELWQKYGSRP